jgi:hypothetical protein
MRGAISNKKPCLRWDKHVIRDFLKLITKIKTDKDYSTESKISLLTEMQSTMKQHLSDYGIIEYEEIITVIDNALKEIRAGG